MTTGNSIKTVVLLAALTGLFLMVGRMLGGTGGMVFAFILALVMNVGSYWFSDRIALAMAGARDVSHENAPELHRIVDELAAFARMPKPRIYIIDSITPNAFATGRDPEHAAVAVTTGIMQILSRDELSGVLAHEMAHVKNRDTLIATIVATVAGAITMIADMARWAMLFGGFGRSDDEEGSGIGDLAGGFLMLFLAPIAALLIQLAISRAREYSADATGAKIYGNPLPLASALEKLEMANRRVPMEVNNVAAHLFIVNPLSGGIGGLFSTHPPTAERVARLRNMAFGRLMTG
ncbi:MAG: zinc metalloprotease HtpX [Chloroflexi bacterium]|nr:zinc metalloprotease HtpX [Chloroflexota bacterium]